METIVIKVNQANKAKNLVEMLKSMDFISNVTYFDKMTKAKKFFDEINKIAEKTELSTLTLEEINQEISNYRNGK